jgi:hypothetical protein
MRKGFDSLAAQAQTVLGGGAESSAALDAARRDRLADAAADMAARAGRLIFDLAKAATN